MKPVNLLLPFTPVRVRWLHFLVAAQALAALGLWALSGSRALPSPLEVAAPGWISSRTRGCWWSCGPA